MSKQLTSYAMLTKVKNNLLRNLDPLWNLLSSSLAHATPTKLHENCTRSQHLVGRGAKLAAVPQVLCVWLTCLVTCFRFFFFFLYNYSGRLTAPQHKIQILCKTTLLRTGVLLACFDARQLWTSWQTNTNKTRQAQLDWWILWGRLSDLIVPFLT